MPQIPSSSAAAAYDTDTTPCAGLTSVNRSFPIKEGSFSNRQKYFSGADPRSCNVRSHSISPYLSNHVLLIGIHQVQRKLRAGLSIGSQEGRL